MTSKKERILRKGIRSVWKRKGYPQLGEPKTEVKRLGKLLYLFLLSFVKSKHSLRDWPVKWGFA